MKKVLLIGLYICFFTNINADSIRFTKQQMLEDFDFLYEKIRTVNPHLGVRYEVTGTDILAKIKNNRKSIDTVSSESSYYDIIAKTFLLCQDGHTNLILYYPDKYTDTSYINQAIKTSQEFKKKYFKYSPYSSLKVFYINGEYFFPDIFDNENVLQIPKKAKLLKINGIDIDEYVEKWNVPIHPSVRWDQNRKKYYTLTIFPPSITGLDEKFLITYSYGQEIKEIELTSFRIKYPQGKGSRDIRVNYFDKDKILYIRVPAMDASKIDHYKQEIEKHKGKEISKVLIDVRSNGGGNDLTWKEILASIIKDTINIPQKLCFKDSHVVKQLLDKQEIPIAENTPLIIGQDSLFCITGYREIIPSNNSILHNGNIYVIINESCYSSTLAFSSACKTVSKLITIGTPTGILGGEGIRPFYFVLPNSKLIFSIASSLDGNVQGNDVENYYHDDIEIPIYPDLDYYCTEFEYKDEFYDEYFLYNIDPVFKTILKLE
ncbi:MAG: S41 family peptidase [Prevotellaceae bacterium]|jgi:hypothetical protein|nr:S41 family peptidase [Prevotellaceae bacterium]